MITIIGSRKKEFKLYEYSSAILMEPREYHDSSILAYNSKEDRFMYCMENFLEQLTTQGMSSEEAYEWFHYNTLGTYVSNYPVFLDSEGNYIETCSTDEYEYIEDDWNTGE